MPFPVEAKWIDAMETEMGYKFPSIFRAKYLRENGGEFSHESDHWWLHPVYDQTDKKRITRTCNSIARETRYAKESSSRFPQDAVNIGHNGSGDELVLLPEQAGSTELSEV